MHKISLLIICFFCFVESAIFSGEENFNDAAYSKEMKQKSNTYFLKSFYFAASSLLGACLHSWWKKAETNKQIENLMSENSQMTCYANALSRRLNDSDEESRKLKEEIQMYKHNDKLSIDARGDNIHKEQKIAQLKEKRRSQTKADFGTQIIQTLRNCFQNDGDIELLLELEEVKKDLQLKKLLQKFLELLELAHNAHGALFQEIESYIRKNYVETEEGLMAKNSKRTIWGSLYTDPKAKSPA